jgi:pimeloyl-ACP methyl ester carboxylesterase
MTDSSFDTTTSADGTTIAFDRHGDAPSAIVLVPGIIQHRLIDSSLSRMAAALAAGGRTVIHYDRRGRGDSTDTPPYDVQREIEDLAAVIDAVGGSAAAFGMSSGGLLALEAARAGLPITALAVYEIPAQMPDTPPNPGLIEAVEAACAAGRPGDAVAAFMTPLIGADGVDGMRQSPVWPALEAIAPTIAYDPRVVARSVGPDGAYDPSRFAALDVPVLVINGERGFGWMADAADATAAAIPGARRQTLPGQTHQADVDVLGPALDAFFHRG